MALMKFIRDWHYSFNYTNHRGETATRRVRFLAMEHGANDWYSDPQFFLRGVDLQKNVIRSFAVARIETLSVRRLHGG